MSDPYLGEIKLISFNFPPRGWAFCNGQLLPINQNQALYSILGVQYGGNGMTNFALPNLQARMPVHQGSGLIVGQSGGEAAHTLTLNELPPHTHQAVARTEPGSPGTSPSGSVWAPAPRTAFGTAVNALMATGGVSSTGGGQPHENQAPLLVLNFVIALQGVFPSRN